MEHAFLHFKAFAAYALQQKALADEMARYYLALCRENDLPLLSFFSHMSEEELLNYSKTGILDFLGQVQENTALSHGFAVIDGWKQNQHPFIPSAGVTVTDVVLVYGLRKQVFLQFLSRFTQEVDRYAALVQELDTFHRRLEQYAFEAYMEVQQGLLKKEKELSESIINNSIEGIMAFDTQERFVLWNKALEKRYGRKKEEVLGKTFLEVYPDLKGTEQGKNLEKALKGEKIFLQDQINPFRYGWYEAHLIPLLDKEEKPFGAVSIVRDITQWKENQITLKEQQEEILASNEELQEKQQEIYEAYEKLKEQEHFITQVTDSVPNGIFIYDLLEHRNVYANKEFFRLLGYMPEELLAMGNKLYSTLIHPEDLPKIDERDQSYQQLKEGETLEAVYRYKTKKGEYRHIRSVSRVYKYTAGGKPWQVLGATEDVTDRLRQEQELRRSRDYYLTILEDFPSLIWRANTEGQCDYFNKTWLEYRGRTLEQEWGYGWADGVHPDDMERCLDIYTTNFKARTPFSMEYRLLRADGVYRWIIDSGIPLHDESGTFTGFLGSCFDIQERTDIEQEIQQKNRDLSKALEALKNTQDRLLLANETLEQRVQNRTEQLEAGQRQLRVLTNALPTLISYIDQHQMYRFVNDTYSRWFGLPKEEIEGRHIKDIVGDEVYEIMQPYLLKALAGEEVKMEGKMAYRYGGNRTVSTSLIPHRVHGEVSGCYALVYDISDIRKAQESLEQALEDITLKNEQLSKINNDLDNFVYTASHDLRNPLVNMEGLLMALKKRLASLQSDELDVLTGMMEKSITKLNQTIRDLTEITKAQKGLSEPEEKISIPDKLEDIKADLQQSIQQANPVLHEELQVKYITYARRNLRSILYNLLTNALKYRSQERQLEIAIRTYQENEWIVLEVQDNGLGLSEQQVQKLFTMFKRLHTHVEGTGIGLYIIKRIVENNGGRIEVSSQQNVGSTFKVYLKKEE